MPSILSVGEYSPPNVLTQQTTLEFARHLFQEGFPDINRLLKVFDNGQIKKRHFAQDLDWYREKHSLEEKNDLYIEKAVAYGIEAIKECLHSKTFLKNSVPYEEINAFFFISTTGMATPSVEARIMNKLPFSPHTKRIPIWGLGCAGGTAGIARAFEYCKAFPNAKVIVLSVELCSLTFQKDDTSKSNLIGTSLFADGVACLCVVGDEVDFSRYSNKKHLPSLLGSQSTLMKNSLDVMGWDMKNEGLFVIFSKDIPSIIRSGFRENVQHFLQEFGMSEKHIAHFIAHPGGKKVLDAYQDSLDFNDNMIKVSRDVLSEHGNMSSATVLYVLKRFMESENVKTGDIGLAVAMGPGFSSEFVLLQWRGVS